jgi:hypothetical protein
MEFANLDWLVGGLTTDKLLGSLMHGVIGQPETHDIGEWVKYLTLIPAVYTAEEMYNLLSALLNQTEVLERHWERHAYA